MDITHYGSIHFLTLIDCGHSWFVLCQPLCRQDPASLVCQLEPIFYEQGPPIKLWTDNDTAFNYKQFKKILHDWGVHLQF